MFAIKIPIVVANKVSNGVSFSEEALKDIVTKFKVNNKPIPVSYIIPDMQAALPLGVIQNLEYNEQNKVLEATITIALDFGLGGTATQKLSTPEGVRVTSFDLQGLGAVLSIPKQPQSKIIK